MKSTMGSVGKGLHEDRSGGSSQTLSKRVVRLADVRLARKGNPHRSARLRVVWGISAALLYLLCIIGANWLLATFGVVTILGLAMPAGVFAAGVSFGARDWLQETAGRPAVILGIAVGAILSTVVSPLRYALASGLAFLFSETCDMLVYSPLRTNHRAWAVTASNTVGAVVDSAVFLLIAFGTLTFFWGQVLGKELMIAPALVVLWLVRGRRGGAPAAVAVAS